MVDKNEIRAAFSARLHEALNDAGVRLRGRGVDIHIKLKELGVNKTTQAVSKWLNEEAIPEADSILALSQWLQVRREWLEYGIHPKQADSLKPYRSAVAAGMPLHTEQNKEWSLVPLRSWHESSLLEPQQSAARQLVMCPIPISADGFALIVEGDAMTNPGLGRSYPAGSTIYVDPSAEIKIGDRVVAGALDSTFLTFKVLAQDGGRQYLLPINPQYPAIDITGQIRIFGKVIGSFTAD